MSFVFCFFFFKQKTAYDMRISDWSSDVCSSDLQWGAIPVPRQLIGQAQLFVREAAARNRQEKEAGPEGRTQARSARGRQGDEVRRRSARGAACRRLSAAPCTQIGRASCREGVWQTVEITAVAV